MAHRASSAQEQPKFHSHEVFNLNTCQRSLWVYRDRADSSAKGLEEFQGIEIFSGEQAYEFLLSVACGLQSKILGETNIFGQLKEAWERFCEGCGKEESSSLAPVFHKLFEDTKEIRSQFLRSSGGDSYGLLVRRFFKRQNPAPGPILLLGAGDIAQSVAPALADLEGHELWILNRDPHRAQALYETLKSQIGSEARLRVIEKTEEDWAFAQASHLVVCIPFDSTPEGDIHRVNLWRNKSDQSLVIHLAGPRSQGGAWLSIPHFHCLDDLFAFQESHGKIKSMQIQGARKACSERAKLRALGSSVSIAHGWEYLAAFG